MQEKTGLVIDAYFSASKLQWVLDHVAGARALAERAVEMAKLLVAGTIAEVEMVGGGRKGHHLDVKAQT